MYVCTVCMHVCMKDSNVGKYKVFQFKYMFAYKYLHAYTYISSDIRVCMNVCKHACSIHVKFVCICMYACMCSGRMLPSELRGGAGCLARGSPGADGAGTAADCKQFLYIGRAAVFRVGYQGHLPCGQEVQPDLRVEVAAASGVGMLAPSHTCMCWHVCLYVCMDFICYVAFKCIRMYRWS